MQDVLVVVRLGRGRHGRERQDQDGVSGHAMVLVELLGVVEAAVEARRVVLREPDQGLHVEQRVRDQAEDGVHALEVVQLVPRLIHLDHDEPGDQGAHARGVQDAVDVGALTLLRRRVCGLE